MSSLREEIRSILREEIAAIKTQLVAAKTETIRIGNSDDLNQFAKELLKRSETLGFKEQVLNDELRFELSDTRPQMPVHTMPIVSSSAPQVAQQNKDQILKKKLITEKDISALGEDLKVLRILKQSRLTPLAKDEVRHRGIKIERVQG